MKIYVKPELFYESFEMNQSIAACAFDMNQTESMNCQGIGDNKGDKKFNMTGFIVFSADPCNMSNEESKAAFEAYCYENATDDKRLWNS